jgi:hypothetical protein
MFFKRNRKRYDEQLDQLGREIARREQLEYLERELVRAAQMNDQELQETASSPFLYTRIRARISDARLQSDAASENWIGGILTSWRPLAGMSVTTILAAALFWFTAMENPSQPASTATGVEESFATSQSHFENIVFTGGNDLSRDDVLQTLVALERQDSSDVQK